MEKIESNSKKFKMKTIRLREDVIDNVETMAKRDNRTFTNMVETILMRESQKNNLNSL